MSNTKIRFFLMTFSMLLCLKLNSQDSIQFFNAKSEIEIEKNGVLEKFTAFVRFNLKDTLWLSFVGTFGIEGARMLITKDTTFILNKIDKSFSSFSNNEINEIFPYVFSLQDWKTLLLNMPSKSDSGTLEMFMDNEIHIATSYTGDRIQKVFTKNNRIIKCELNNKRHGLQCEIVYDKYDSSKVIWDLARQINLKINRIDYAPVNIRIRYLDFGFNQPKSFQFNTAKYKNEKAP